MLNRKWWYSASARRVCSCWTVEPAKKRRYINRTSFNQPTQDDKGRDMNFTSQSCGFHSKYMGSAWIKWVWLEVRAPIWVHGHLTRYIQMLFSLHFWDKQRVWTSYSSESCCFPTCLNCAGWPCSIWERGQYQAVRESWPVWRSKISWVSCSRLQTWTKESCTVCSLCARYPN